MIKLRHINGKNLKELEQQLQSLQFNPTIISVNNVSGNWYIHFLIGDLVTDIDKPIIQPQVTQKTKTLKKEK